MRQFFLILFILLPLSILNAQDTIYVPGDYSTIQAAIDAALNGDVVLVDEDTYYENINFKGKAITVASYFLVDGGLTHIENTIIDGSTSVNPDSGSVVCFVNGEDTTSVLCGFTITGGSGTYLSGSDYRVGGGIMIFLSGAKVCHNIITSNSIDNSTTYTRCYGGGIMAYSQPSNLIISNNVISNNSIVNSSVVGGGISIYDNGPTWIISNKIINNVINANGGSGGGIDIWNSNNELYVMNNIIKGNQVLTNSSGGGGIDIWNSSSPIFISNNLIAENVAYRGGGVLVEDYVDEDSRKMKNLNFKNHNSGESDILDNPTSSSNKLLFEATFENNTIVNNNATNYCGGIFCDNIVSPEIRNSIIWGNEAPAGAQIEGSGPVEYSDVQGGIAGNGNIDVDPVFADSVYYLLTEYVSLCIDAGNPDPQYNDVENPLNPGNPLPPALGTLQNDMGHAGGPASLWGFWDWPVPVELTLFTASVQFGKVNLNWTTATETNNLGFEIERKQDNNNWERIGFVDGHGTTVDQQEYFYLDDVSNMQASSFAYRLKQIDYEGSYEYSDEVLVDISAPVEFALQQNYPNPFNPTTTISFSLPLKSQVELVIYNTLGESETQLVNEEKEAGKYTVEFNAANLPSGIYFYQIKAGDFVQVKKMMLLK